MRPSSRVASYVCLSCRLREGAKSVASGPQSSGHELPHDIVARPPSQRSLSTSVAPAGGRNTLRRAQNTGPAPNHVRRPITIRQYVSTSTESIEQSSKQMDELQTVSRLRHRLQAGIREANGTAGVEAPGGLSFEEALKRAVPTEKGGPLLKKSEDAFVGRESSRVTKDSATTAQHRRSGGRIVTDPHTRKLQGEFGHLEKHKKQAAEAPKQKPQLQRRSALLKARIMRQRRVMPFKIRPIPLTNIRKLPNVAEIPAQNQFRAKVPRPAHQNTMQHPASKVEREDLPPVPKHAIAKLDEGQTKKLVAQSLTMRALRLEKTDVPGLSFGLDRVLFNPGVYQLQDPRTGVFNFDPYLKEIMPVWDFDFDSLSEYVTSSKDATLDQLARHHGKRYVGSSSSMSSALMHFHHLLGQYRDISTKLLSQGFTESSKSFTQIQKAPSALFLRNKGGVYGVDADKEFDTANILMSLGRSLEKLFTLPKDAYERFRKSAIKGEPAEVPSGPEAYHYCEQGDFLLRSQLDAYDPRLPGSGMFDLKTRAVVSIRMNIRRHEDGLGYQINSRYGSYESYEREYYDMIRSAFLKYSLQVRMGRMDGIFVAYHNVEEMFGFQYIPLSEMDAGIHGQEDRCLGDQEFNLSIKLMNEVFDRATQRFPERSLRFHFETREGTAKDPAPYMYIFAEAMSEEAIEKSQDSKKKEIAEFERRLFTPPDVIGSEGVDLSKIFEPLKRPEGSDASAAISDNAADSDFLNALSAENVALGSVEPMGKEANVVPLLAMRLSIRNSVDGQPVQRPVQLKKEHSWTVDYTMVEMSPDVGQRLHRMCLQRRKMAFAQTHEDTTNNHFFKNLKRLSQQGAALRQQKRKVAAGQEVRVLQGSDAHAASARVVSTLHG